MLPLLAVVELLEGVSNTLFFFHPSLYKARQVQRFDDAIASRSLK